MHKDITLNGNTYATTLKEQGSSSKELDPTICTRIHHDQTLDMMQKSSERGPGLQIPYQSKAITKTDDIIDVI